MGREFDRSVLIGIALLAALVAANAGVSLWNTRHVHDNAGRVAHTHEVMAASASVRADLREMEAAQRTFLLTGDESAHTSFLRAAADARDGLARLRELTADNADQQSRLTGVGDALERTARQLETTVQTRRRDGMEAAARVVAGGASRRLLNEIESLMAEIDGAERILLADRTRANDRAYSNALLFGAAAAGFGLVAVGLFVWLLRRSDRTRAEAAAAVHREREWLRTTLASIGDAVIATDDAGNVTFLNPVAERLTEWPQAEASGQPLTRVFHIVNETSRREVENPALRALKEGVIVGLANHTILIGRGGTERLIDDSAAPIRDGGAVGGAVLVFRDISERKKAEEVRARLAAIVESSDDAIVGKTLDGVIRSWNAGAERVFGWTAAEAVGQPITLIIPPERLDEERDIIGRLRRGERIDHFETVRVAKGGRRVGISLTVSPIRDSEGHVVGASKVARDVTDRRRAEEALRVERERSEFVLGATGVGFWYCNLPFDVLQWDERVKAHFWLPPDAPVTIDTFYARIHPDDRGPTRAAIERSIADRAGYDTHYRTVDPATGAEKWVRAIGRTFCDAAGAPRRFDGITMDVTEQRRAEAALLASEERHRALVTATADVVYRMSADWEVMHPLDGRGLVPSSAEAIRGWMDVNLPAFEHPRVWEAIRRAIATRGTFELEHRVNRPDGTTGWTFFRAVPILDAAGDIAEWFGAARDITERREVDEGLQRSHDTFLNLIQNNPFGVCLVDADFRLARVSLGAQKVFAHVRPLLGRDFADVLRAIWAEPAATEFVGIFRSTLATGEPYVSVDTTARRADVDDVESYDWRIERVPLPDGRHGVVCYFYDMTDRRRIEDALKDADRKKDDFIALLAHELRNPLAPIRNGLQVIRLSEDRGTRDRAQRMMDRQLAHMVRMIDDLLDVSRIGRNKMELRRARVALADVVASAVETARPAVEEAGHELTVALPPGPVHLDVDLTRLSQVLSNLLTNSAKYTERGGKIVLSAALRGGAVVVTVRDSGIGIPAVALPTIFDMFSQVDRPTERTAGGLGIGLALVKGLVEMHGGTVTAASEGQGRGSEFVVTLPLPGGEPSFAEPVPDGGPGGPGVKRRVLVVDDSRDGAESLAMMLALLGNEVAVAHDGVEAVERAGQFRPEVVLMDVGMPLLNGLDATRRIREQAWGRGMTIIALTGWGQEGDRARSREAGCDGHLVKPVNLSDLEKLLAELPGGRAG